MSKQRGFLLALPFQGLISVPEKRWSPLVEGPVSMELDGHTWSGSR